MYRQQILIAQRFDPAQNVNESAIVRKALPEDSPWHVICKERRQQGVASAAAAGAAGDVGAWAACALHRRRLVVALLDCLLALATLRRLAGSRSATRRRLHACAATL